MFCIKCGVEKELGERCKNCAKIYHAKYHQIHQQELNQRSTKWYADNKEIVSQQYKNDEFKKTRKRQYNNDYERNRKITDPIFKLRRNCSRLVNHVLNGSKNGQSILDYLPYTMDELKRYLENQFDDKMNWDNYGIYWHIDHIYPQSLLPYTSMEDENFKKCWALKNLQPLEAVENMKKSNKLVR
jgi:hypothetical protein